MAQKQQINPNLLIYAGLGLGAYFLITKLLKGLGFSKSDEQIAAEKLAAEGTRKFIDEVQKKPNPKQAFKGKPSRPEGQYAIWANQIYEYLKYSALDDKKKQAFELLYIYVHNDADIAKLIKYFGKRQEYNFGIPIGQTKDLSQFVTTNLSSNQIKTLNDRYAKSKMIFRF
jgi:hypothetical protein